MELGLLGERMAQPADDRRAWLPVQTAAEVTLPDAH